MGFSLFVVVVIGTVLIGVVTAKYGRQEPLPNPQEILVPTRARPFLPWIFGLPVFWFGLLFVVGLDFGFDRMWLVSLISAIVIYGILIYMIVMYQEQIFILREGIYERNRPYRHPFSRRSRLTPWQQIESAKAGTRYVNIKVPIFIREVYFYLKGPGEEEVITCSEEFFDDQGWQSLLELIKEKEIPFDNHTRS